MFKKKLKDFGYLLKEQLYLLGHSKCFIVLSVVMVFYSFIEVGGCALLQSILYDFSGSGYLTEDASGLTSQFSINAIIGSNFSSDTLGIFLLIFASIFVCAEFSQKTIRNKIVAGFSRTVVYLSSLTFQYLVAIYFILLETVLFLAIGIPMLGWQYSTISVAHTFALMFVTIPLVAFFHMVCYLTRSKGLTIVFDLIFLFAFWTIGSLLVRIYTLDSSNAGIEWSIRLIFLNLETMIKENGVGDQNTMSYFALTLVLNYLITAVLATVIGWLAFRRADIK
jgi:ABC-type transport system involved in multi-copper enzyme maturation permease subunit